MPLTTPPNEPAHARMIERAEAERVEQRDRARAHGEHVAQDAADARRRTLIRLDRRRMIVRLDLERDGQAVTDGDDAGVFTGALQDVRRLRRAASCRTGRECLYEQCSLQSALTMPSSVNVGVRPSMSTRRWYSSGVSPCSATSAGVMTGSPGRGTARHPLRPNIERTNPRMRLWSHVLEHLHLTLVEPHAAAVLAAVDLHVVDARSPSSWPPHFGQRM